MNVLRPLLLLAAALPPTLNAQEKPRKSPQPMLLPQAVVVPRGERELQIDGSLIDWPELPAMVLSDRRQLSGTAHDAWRGPADTSAFAFMMWDQQSLYVACAVRDEWHRALDPKTMMLTEVPAADSVVLTFDPERNTRSNGPDPGRREDREFWLADEASREVVRWDRLRGSAEMLEAPARMVALHDKEQGITTYEARIPWQQILPASMQAEVGLCVDLQIVVNDFDENTDSMPQTRIGWTFGSGAVIDPGLLGTIMLVADTSAMRGVVPEFPPKPGTKEPPAEPIDYWRDLTARLLSNGPAVYDGTLTPAEVGGVERFEVLEAIDRHCERMPRVDVLELHQRIHRRMNREVRGLMARGLPSWWAQRMESVSKVGADLVPGGGARLFRLPMGGWMVRSSNNLLVDAAGPDLARWLWGGAEMCVLTQPLDITRRSDQLLVRMLSVEPKRPVYSHLAFHLPVIAMEDLHVVKPGETYGEEGRARITALCKPREDGAVPYDCSYLVELVDGPKLLFVSPTLPLEAVDGIEGVDAMIASSRNPQSVEIARNVKPGIVLFDDAFVCQTLPQVPRVTLNHIHLLQRALLPTPSVVLAPGESWLVKAAK